MTHALSLALLATCIFERVANLAIFCDCKLQIDLYRVHIYVSGQFLLQIMFAFCLQGYHVLAVGLFLPALFLDPPFLSLALSIALALLVLIEAIRIAQVPYLGKSFALDHSQGCCTPF